jgi:Zn-dependent protease with chaperone function
LTSKIDTWKKLRLQIKYRVNILASYLLLLLSFLTVIGIGYFSYSLRLYDEIIIPITGFQVVFFWLVAPSVLISMVGYKRCENEEILQAYREVCKALRIPRFLAPNLLESESEEVQALAVGASIPFLWSLPVVGSNIVLYKGLVTTLNREELKAVMGHELGHCLAFDSGLRSTLGILSTLLSRCWDVLRGSKAFSTLPFFGSLSVLAISYFVLPNILVPACAAYVSQNGELLADIKGAQATSPEAMISVLQKISAKNSREGKEKARFRDITFSSHPTLDKRIKVMMAINSFVAKEEN